MVLVSDAAVPMEIAPVVPTKAVPLDSLMLPPVVAVSRIVPPAVMDTSEPADFTLVPTAMSMAPAWPEDANPVATERAPDDT